MPLPISHPCRFQQNMPDIPSFRSPRQSSSTVGDRNSHSTTRLNARSVTKAAFPRGESCPVVQARDLVKEKLSCFCVVCVPVSAIR